jgi:hypothetical protein
MGLVVEVEEVREWNYRDVITGVKGMGKDLAL